MRIFFLTSTRIGDAILSTGLLDHLLRQHPEARVTVACGAVSAPLFAAVPQLERLIPVRKQSYNRHWLKLWAQVVGRRWDLVVDLRASALGHLLRSGARKTIGARSQEQPRPVELAELFGLAEVPAPRVWTSAANDAEAERLVPPGPPVLALGPAANWVGKQWAAERFAELAMQLTGPDGLWPGGRVAVLAAGHERAQAQPVLERVGPERAIDLVGGVDLPAAAACLRKAVFFIGNDSGLMHLAAAAGTPTLGLFGPTPDQRYAPWGRHCAVVRTPESYEALCPPPGVPHGSIQHSLMGGLAVETVVEAASALWRRQPGWSTAQAAGG